MQFVTTLRTARAGQIKSAFDAGGANTGKLEVRTGAAAGVANSAGGTLLGTLTAVTITNNSDGTLTFAATADSDADATGTPGHVRGLTSADAVVAEFTSAVSSGEFNFDDDVTENGTISLSGGTSTEGNA